ncbi:unnamed protein product [Porites lobata]|uniref:Uncharacterized protein n=1 Tax=Porites lobata TaxID=104759 RepID=A0ABN8S9A9_9CNID|nr:unnamed protein product [Porites lobata]
MPSVAPIGGDWGRWSNWSPCSKTCNDGVETRFRRCDNPPPGHNRKQCPGSSTEEGMCINK